MLKGVEYGNELAGRGGIEAQLDAKTYAAGVSALADICPGSLGALERHLWFLQ